ncbi:hypothetical protein QP938_08215 [Porticoccaceae bacterium LTM1]|nr:hypothetical protein QP938_08215 [Porticoccaceae bacterium LTM1]
MNDMATIAITSAAEEVTWRLPVEQISFVQLDSGERLYVRGDGHVVKVRKVKNELKVADQRAAELAIWKQFIRSIIGNSL